MTHNNNTSYAILGAFIFIIGGSLLTSVLVGQMEIEFLAPSIIIFAMGIFIYRAAFKIKSKPSLNK